jgi:2'-5' RNA ligase/phage gp29-like protein
MHDAVIATLLDAMTMPLVAAEFGTKPAGDTLQDKINAKFLEECMHDMTDYSWRQHVLDMLSMLSWGWSVSEIVFKRRDGLFGTHPSKHNDGRIGLHILDPRGQETLYKWDMDEDFNVRSMVQKDPNNGELLHIPYWKMVHSTFRSKKRSPEGTSPLRTLYRAWYTRKNLEVIEAIGAERDAAGLPVIYLPYGANDTDKANAENLIRNVRQDEEAGLIIPAPPSVDATDNSKWRFELLSSPGSKQYNIRQIVSDLNKIILMRFFAQFLMLGMDHVGSQALVEGSQDFFSLCLKSIQDELLETWNHQLVPLLFSLNPQMMTGASGYPGIDWTAPGSKDVQKVISAVQGLITAQLVTPESSLEDYFRMMLDLPDRPEGVGEGPRGAAPQSPFGPGMFGNMMNYEWFQTAEGGWLLKPKQKTTMGNTANFNQRPAEYVADRSCMVAIDLPDEVARTISIPGGLAPEEMHITLTYNGKDLTDGEVMVLKKIASAVCRKHQPMNVKITCIGTFEENDEGKTPCVAFVECSELLEMRKELATSLKLANIFYADDYEYTPHITIKYLDHGEETPFEDLSGVFVARDIVVAFGDKWERVGFDSEYTIKAEFAEVSGIDGRDARAKAGEETNRYQRLLTRIYDDWSKDAMRQILGALRSGRQTAMNEISRQVVALSQQLKAAGRENLEKAVQIGYRSDIDSQAMLMVSQKTRENDLYIDNSLIPRIREKLTDKIVTNVDNVELDDKFVRGLFQSMRSEPASYAGAFWSSIFLGAGLAMRVEDQERKKNGQKPRRVRWVLDPNADHCKASAYGYGCEDLAGEYESWDDLPTVPAGQVTCLGNCRCHIDVENDSGGWDRVA